MPSIRRPSWSILFWRMRSFSSDHSSWDFSANDPGVSAMLHPLTCRTDPDDRRAPPEVSARGVRTTARATAGCALYSTSAANVSQPSSDALGEAALEPAHALLGRAVRPALRADRAGPASAAGRRRSRRPRSSASSMSPASSSLRAICVECAHTPASNRPAARAAPTRCPVACCSPRAARARARSCRAGSARGGRPRARSRRPARSRRARRSAARARRRSPDRCTRAGRAGSRTGPIAALPVPQPDCVRPRNSTSRASG